MLYKVIVKRFSWYSLLATFISNIRDGNMCLKMDIQNDSHVLSFGEKIVIVTNFCIDLVFLCKKLNEYS